MASRIVLRNHRHPVPVLLQTKSLSSSSSERSANVAEVAAVATADCAAVCCCAPCGIVHLVVLAVYKAPSCLVRRVLNKKRRQRLLKNGALMPPQRRWGFDDLDVQIFPTVSEKELLTVRDMDKEEMELEKEMWERFYEAGFWRSPSQIRTDL